jgi:hypothetical protein
LRPGAAEVQALAFKAAQHLMPRVALVKLIQDITDKTGKTIQAMVAVVVGAVAAGMDQPVVGAMEVFAAAVILLGNRVLTG